MVFETLKHLNPHGDTIVRAQAADLLLMLWERADAAAQSERFTVEGEIAIVSALHSMPIHR